MTVDSGVMATLALLLHDIETLLTPLITVLTLLIAVLKQVNTMLKLLRGIGSRRAVKKNAKPVVTKPTNRKSRNR